MSLSVPMPAGIDFGNENCVIAVTTRNGVEIVLNECSNRLTPTMITFTGERRYVGELSQQNQMQFVQGTIRELKRLIMLPYESEERQLIQADLPQLVPLPDGTTGIVVQSNGQPVTLRPEQLIAYMLKDLMRIARLKDPNIDKCVIAVSPWWTEKHRRALLSACAIAGIDCISLVNSTTSAAIAYTMLHRNRLPKPNEKPVAVAFVDFGNSALNVAMAFVKQGMVEMKSLTDDNHLGGSDFTIALTQYLLQKVRNQYHVDPAQHPRTMLRFKQAVEKVKKTLSVNPVVMFEVQSVMGVDIAFPVKREEFNDQIGHLLERIQAPIEKALEVANLKKQDLFEIQVLGGGSRVFAVQQKLSEIFGRQPQKSLNLDECFAVGSGYLGALLSPRMAVNLVVKDVCPHAVKAVWDGGEQEVFKQFSFIPTSKIIHVKVDKELHMSLQAGSEEIGRIRIITGVSEPVSVSLRIRITQSGTCQVAEALFDHGKSSHEAVVESLFVGDMTPEEIENYRSMEATFEQVDIIAGQREDAKNELESVLFMAESDVERRLKDVMTPDETKHVKDTILQVQLWMEATEFDDLTPEDYQAQIRKLQDVISPIMKRKQ